jgi:hypothetical protein
MISIVTYELYLVIKRLKLHPAPSRMLYIEEMLHEIQRTIFGIEAHAEMPDLLIRIVGLAMRLLDEDTFKCF